MKLSDFLRAERGRVAAVARLAGLAPAFLSQIANGVRQAPDAQCPAIEQACRELGGHVPCEELRPDLTWVRVPADGWPDGKPVLDVAPNGTIQMPAQPIPPAPRPEREASHPVAAGHTAAYSPAGPTLMYGDRRVLGDRRHDSRPTQPERRRRDRREW